ncbi:MAG: nucleotidyltransferase family protein [Candidatus Zixiibacteriota bacterium]|nr:MAG: nucleotidyltransferase family protein [candidate division Zixibacteria bacterium]
MEVVILAGGKGSRLLPHTAEIPKPLVPIGDTPIVEILLRQLKKAGVTKVHMAVSHMANLIMNVVGDGNKFGLEIVCSTEEKPLSTAGPLKLIKHLPEHFVVANGDILSDIDIRALYNQHVAGDALLSIATYEREENIDYGVLETSAENVVTGFSEKPSYHFTVSMGIYVFSRAVLEFIPRGKPFGFDELVLELLQRGKKIASYPYDGYWQDIGRPDDYARAQADIERIKGLL